MKKITYILIALLVISTGVYAQGQMDALRFSQGDVFGTARAMGMGGAFGALGGDQTGVSINPAGIAIYRSSEIVGTFQFMSNIAKVDNETARRNSFNMPNIGFVSYFPLRNHVMPFINIGFTYNQSQTFNRRVSAHGELRSSLLDYIADRSFGKDPFHLSLDHDHDPFRSQPWLSVLAYNSQLMFPTTRDIHGRWSWEPVNTTDRPISQIYMRERGFIDNFGFTIGTTISDVVSIGAALTVTTVSYRLDSEYDEDFPLGGYTLSNMLTVDGAGIGGRFGVIFRPIHEFRIGVSYHTPTRFALRQTFRAEMIHDMEYYIEHFEPFNGYRRVFSGRFPSENEFDLRTPGRWVFSAATILGDFIASVDYEITDFSRMRFLLPAHDRRSRDWFNLDNDDISTDFRMASTLRLGLDYRLTPQLSVRAGYVWQQNPNTDTFKRNADIWTPGSNAIFVVEGDTNIFTAGLGYRFNRNFFMDFALVYRTQNNQLYAFPNILFDNGDFAVDATSFDMRNTSLRGVLTLGYRF